jgi:DNA-binding transcriptional MocR family regulator
MNYAGWVPRATEGAGPLYRRVADALQEEIASGRLVAGERLPTHRGLASSLGITVVTASRVYNEAARRGLIEGGVGRGTFVATRAAVVVEDQPLVDLTASYIGMSAEVVGPEVAQAAAQLMWEQLPRRVPAGGAFEHRAAGAQWLSRDGFSPRPDQVVLTSGAQHGIVAALSALSRPSDTVYTEALTYPGIGAAARHLRLRLQPIPIDGEGLIPEELEARCKGASGGGVVYCQPTLQNPMSTVMSLERRQKLVAVARRCRLSLIEDNAYAFLCADAPLPLVALAPERTCSLFTCTKAFTIGLRVGFVVAPAPLVPRLEAEIAATCLLSTPSLVELVTRWILDGTAQRIVDAKRREVARRQEAVRRELADLVVRSHPSSSHLWLELPAPWRPAAVVDQARRNGVAISLSEPFIVDQQGAPAAVRVCLGPVPERARLERALRTLGELLSSAPPPEAPLA